jgi:hypothetical protein
MKDVMVKIRKETQGNTVGDEGHGKLAHLQPSTIINCG